MLSDSKINLKAKGRLLFLRALSTQSVPLTFAPCLWIAVAVGPPTSTCTQVPAHKYRTVITGCYSLFKLQFPGGELHTVWDAGFQAELCQCSVRKTLAQEPEVLPSVFPDFPSLAQQVALPLTGPPKRQAALGCQGLASRFKLLYYLKLPWAWQGSVASVVGGDSEPLCSFVVSSGLSFWKEESVCRTRCCLGRREGSP